jgi:Flp pilus assembly protein TadB
MDSQDGTAPLAKKKKAKKSSRGKGVGSARKVAKTASERSGADAEAPFSKRTAAEAHAGKPMPGRETTTAAFLEAKKWVLGAAVLLLAGVALVAIGDATLGPWLTVAGMATALWGAHRLGRSGPDDAWS